MTNPTIVTIDAGTQSIRAVLLDLKGNIIDIEKKSMQAYFSEHAGWAEQDPEYMWTVLCSATNDLMKRLSLEQIESISGVSLTTQRGTVVNLDANGEAIRPAIIWLDRRQAELENFPSPLLKLGLKGVRMYDSVCYSFRECEANWIRQNQPDIWHKTEKYLYLSGYFTYRLTNQFVDSVGSMVGYMPFDYKKQTWAKEGHINRRMFPIEQHKLFNLVKPSEKLGNISKKSAQETGLPEGLPLVAAASDKASEVLGSGALQPNLACLSYGTTATVQTTSQKYQEVLPFFPPYPSSIPNYYNTEVMIYRGFWMINWFKQEFGFPEVKKAMETGVAPELYFDEMIKDIPPGAMGLTLQPYWSPGVKEPGLEAKGAIIGFGDVHTRAHIYRAILEGLAYALRHGLERTQKRTKKSITALRVSGGGSQSHHAMQLTADIFGLPVEKPHTYETSALGAAINAAVGLKHFNSFESATNAMTRVSETFLPISANQATYNKLYTQVYRKMYSRLQPLYQAIRQATGYPRISK